jgi:predicted nucleotidyltransferase
MANVNEWRASFKEALDKRQIYLSDKKIPELKAKFVEFRTAYSTLYAMLLQRNIIVEDPYKEEARVTNLNMPESAPLYEPKKRENFSIRLSKYDNQLEYIVTFCIFSLDMLKPDKIKIFQALIWFIDWKNLSRTSPLANTQMMAEFMIKVHANTSNKFAIKNFEACFDTLHRIASDIDTIFKDFNEYYRESYKGEIRAYIAANMDGVVTLDAISARFPIAFRGRLFQTELVEELINEDYSSNAEAMRQNVLQKLAVDEDVSQTDKDAQSNRQLLLESIYALGSTCDTLQAIINKIEHNHEIYQNRRKSFVEIIMEIIAILFNKKLPADFYLCKLPDSNNLKTETIDHYLFIGQLSDKVKILQMFIVGSAANANIQNMSDIEILNMLNRNIYDLQRYSRLLTALDEFFKTGVGTQNKNRIKGMKPEISTIKAALSKAILKKEYYLVGQKLSDQLPEEQ